MIYSTSKLIYEEFYDLVINRRRVTENFYNMFLTELMGNWRVEIVTENFYDMFVTHSMGDWRAAIVTENFYNMFLTELKGDWRVEIVTENFYNMFVTDLMGDWRAAIRRGRFLLNWWIWSVSLCVLTITNVF